MSAVHFAIAAIVNAGAGFAAHERRIHIFRTNDTARAAVGDICLRVLALLFAVDLTEAFARRTNTCADAFFALFVFLALISARTTIFCG